MWGYILELQKNNVPNKELSKHSFFTLYQFTSNTSYSTYQIYKMLKEKEYMADYKNVHKRIQNLLMLNLIERTKEKETPHNAKFYRITSAGIFYLLSQSYDRHFNSHHMLASVIETFGDDEFFKYFVYPFFEKDVLKKIRSDSITEGIFNYFAEICRYVQSEIEFLQQIKEKGGYLDSEIYFWHDLVGSEKNKTEFTEAFLSNIREKFGLTWLGLDTKLQKIDEYRLRIFQNENEMYLKLDHSSGKAILTYKNEIIARYELQPFGSYLSLKEFIPIKLEKYMSEMQHRINAKVYVFLQKLVLSLIVSMDSNYIVKNSQNQYANSLQLLAEDKKFVQLVHTIMITLQKYFKEFMNHGIKDETTATKFKMVRT